MRVGLFALMMVWLVSGNVCAQDAATNDTAVNSIPGTLNAEDAAVALVKDASSVQPSVEQVSTTQPGNVSLDFRETDIHNVLKILSFKSGVNIVAGPEVTGVVSIQLNDVPWQQALDVILQSYGYSYEKKGSILLVTTVENLKKHREDAMALAEQEPVETRTFTLNFAKAAVVAQSVEKMKSERGNLNFDDRTNTLIATDIHSRLEIMADVIKTLDATTPQVMIEGKIVETSFSDTENLGIDWVLKATAAGAKRPTIFPFTSHTNNKYVNTDFGQVQTSELTKEFSYGTLNFSQLQSILELLKSKSDTNILSNPRIVTLDNQAARIVVGSQYPIPSYTYNEEQAKLQVSGWEYKDIGIIFDVTPHVNNAGFVTLEIEPKLTEILDFVTVENTSLPRLSNEQVKTNVMVKSGETLIIAGLIKTKTTDTRKKFPVLGDIPVLGMAFSKKEKTMSKTDVMIFLTPHIITPDIGAEPEKKS